MRLPTLSASTLVVLLTIPEQAEHAFAYYVPGFSSRTPGPKKGLSSGCSFFPKIDELPKTELRVAAAGSSTNLQDDNSYYSGNEEKILKVYEEWRNEHAKGGFDDARYQNFRANYIKLMTANAAELTVARDMGYPDPVPLSLNEYGDLSPGEFNNRHNGRTAPSPPLESPVHDYANSQTAGQNINNSADDQDRVRQIYKEWCVANEKLFDESRLEVFTNNLRVVEKYYRETGKKAELNEYADLSPEEYQAVAMSAGEAGTAPSQPPLESMSTSRHTPPSVLYQYSDETEVVRIQQAYLEWCGFHGREYMDARLDIFATNLLAIESYRAQTGKNAVLNAYADLLPEEYNTMVSNGTAAAPLSDANPNTGTSGFAIYEQEQEQFDTNWISSEMIEEGIRSIYQDWCAYYEKMPSEKGLYFFWKNYVALEKDYRETGVEFTMNEFADSGFSQDQDTQTLEQETQASKEQETRALEEEKIRLERLRSLAREQRRSEEARLQKEAEEKQRREESASLETEESERIEMARRNEEGRQKAEELMRIEAERKHTEEEARRRKEEDERSKFEEARKRVEEAQLTEQKQAAAAVQAALEKRKADFGKAAAQESAFINEDPRLSDLDSEKERLRKERVRLEEALESDRAFLKEERRREAEAKAALEETDRQIDEIMKENEREESERPDSIILPRASYLDAVAKTWVDRTAYLEALQQGTAGALPSNPQLAKAASLRKAEKEKQIKESESLIDSIWNFMKENTMDERGRTENYSWNLIQQADKLIADAESKSTGVVGDELRYLKQAVDAMRRRNNDDVRADRARTEANEWEQIQKGLEKEAKRAKERREHDERIAGEARRKANSLKSERRRHEKRAEEARRQQRSLRDKNKETEKRIRSLSLEPAFGNDSSGQGNPFSFFQNPFEGGESKEASISFTETKKDKNIFSFFGGTQSDAYQNSPPSKAMTQPVKFEKKENWLDAVFGFFAGAETEGEIPGQGTITLEPAKRSSVFDLFVSPDAIAPVKEPGRGSITIDDSQESSIFSFFAKFGVSQKKEKPVDPVRMKRVMDYEDKLRTRQEKLSWLKAGRTRILNEKDKNMSRKEARRLQRELDSLAAGNSNGSGRASDIPQLAKWTRTPDGRITGWISDSSGGRYKMGTKITTSRIKESVVKPGMTVTTVSGSQYRLGLLAPRSSIDSASSTSRNGEKRANAMPSPMGSLFGRLFAEENLPSLVEWTQNEDGTITGFVNNKEGFEDGTQITTSPVERGARKGMVIQTEGGSKYKLHTEKKRNSYDPRPPRF